ncbi:MAG: hypothetical protein Q7T51_02235 [Candidatus Moranbacteria bacterium]|nr:hypothetical protein [Candidatus Moranbacteria bacterium]
MLNKKSIIIFAVVLFGAFLVGFYFLAQKTFNPEIAPVAPAPVAVAPKQDVVVEKDPNAIPAEIKAIMNDNITGTVEKIDAKSITIKAEDGTAKVMPMEDGKTFVIAQINNTMSNKKISEIKVGMKAYVHFEKETNLATTITLL